MNQRIREESDLQSDAIDRYATPPKKRNSNEETCWRKELNPQPFDYKSNALPIELLQREAGIMSKKNLYHNKNRMNFYSFSSCSENFSSEEGSVSD